MTDSEKTKKEQQIEEIQKVICEHCSYENIEMR